MICTYGFSFIVNIFHPFLPLFLLFLLCYFRFFENLIIPMDGLDSEFEDGSDGFKSDAEAKYFFSEVIAKAFPNILNGRSLFRF
jgi:hypothetical protein